jgi:hypothetical protein
MSAEILPRIHADGGLATVTDFTGQQHGTQTARRDTTWPCAVDVRLLNRSS